MKTEAAVPADPRTRSGFLAEYFPKANGLEAPPPSIEDPNSRIELQFLAVYYDLNCEYARLLEVRSETESPQRTQQEREILQAIETKLVIRDQIEDRYAPYGVIAQPILRNGFTIDVKFSFANVNAARKPRVTDYSISAFIPIPLPAGTRLEDLPIKVEIPDPY